MWTRSSSMQSRRLSTWVTAQPKRIAFLCKSIIQSVTRIQFQGGLYGRLRENFITFRVIFMKNSEKKGQIALHKAAIMCRSETWELGAAERKDCLGRILGEKVRWEESLKGLRNGKYGTTHRRISKEMWEACGKKVHHGRQEDGGHGEQDKVASGRRLSTQLVFLKKMVCRVQCNLREHQD